ncbi:anaerobic ribonucleoside-triphosphate reductase activating protein [Candidatus Bathyarchaeota archaeon]|nr:anaerobic ribonucleoside-triphosphate reductase activating protein [Candidatus Bathyarchaeota archaeon]
MSIDFPVVGYRKLSVSDYPGKLSAVITVPGCNFRCPYCPKEKLIHHYIPMEKTPVFDILESLYPRVGFIDGVTLTGGEPLLHKGLSSFLVELRRLGLSVKLDTNASKPRALKRVIEKGLVDYVSVHVVAPLGRYVEVSGYRLKVDSIRDSIQMIRRSSISHEFTVTPVPGIHSRDDILEISRMLAGSRRLVLRRFTPCMSMDPDLRDSKPYTTAELEQLKSLVAPYFNEVEIERPHERGDS